MAVGLYVPVGVSPGGGALLSDGEDNDRKIIFLALGSDDNENAFQQQIGLGNEMVFGVNDPQIRGTILTRIKRLFRQFEAQKRYRLVNRTLKWREDSANQEMILEFEYLNLETDEIQTFQRTFTQSAPEYG